MSDGEMTGHRPLLCIRTERDAGAIRDAGFGGVVLDARTLDAEFASECRAQNLSVWLDLSTLRAPREELEKQQLVFDNLTPRFEIAGDQLDTLHPQSAPVAIEVLEALAGVLSGVLFELVPHASTALPPFAWSEQLAPSFQTRHGFDLLGRIESLVSSGDEAARIRQLYWEEIHLAREENFLEPLRPWCAQREIVFCARHFRVEWNAFALSPNLRARLNAAATTLESAPAFPVVLSDEANLTRDFHGSLRSGASAFARPEYSDLQSAPQKLLNKIIARASSAFAGSRSAAKIGVLFPARSAQTHYHPDGHRLTRWVGDDLKSVTDLLDDLHFDWLFVTEAQLVGAAQSGSTLRAGSNQQEFELIVVPSITAISWQAWEKLEQFVEGGGKVACLGLLPRWSERGRDREFEQRISKTTRIVTGDLYEAYSALESETEMPATIGYPIFREYHSGGRLCCYQPRLNDDAEDARLRVRQILRESVTPDFETLAPDIRYAHRVGASGELFFTANEGEQTRRVNAHLRPRKNGAPIELDAATGEEKPVIVVMPYPPDEGGGTGLAFDLAPAQSRLFEIRNAQLEPPHSLERASFEVEFFDGETATGFMMQSGTPQVALRRDGKIEWHSSADVDVPIPVLLDSEEWSESRSGERTEYSQSVTVPAHWKDCRVFLEVAATQMPVQCVVNNGETEIHLSAPFRFDLTLLLAFGASNDFTVRVWETDREHSPPARLVAYPSVAVKITP